MLRVAPNYLGMLALMLLVVYAGGVLLVHEDNDRSARYYLVFRRLLVGMCVLVVSYSLYRTGWQTVHVLFILPFAYYLFQRIKTRKINSALLLFKVGVNRSSYITFMRDYLHLMLLVLPFFVYEAFFLLKSGTFQYRIPEVDYFFYANLSELLNLTGQENKFFASNLLYPKASQGMVPYHYFELWLNAVVTRFFHVSSVSALLLVTYPLLYLGILTGLLAIWERWGTVKMQHALMSYLLVLLSGLYLHLMEYNLTPQVNGATISSVLSVFGRKLGTVYLFCTFSLVLFFRKDIYGGLLSLSLVAIVSFGAMPGIIGGVAMFMLSNFFHKALPAKQLISLVIYYVVFMAAYLFMFALFGTSYTSDYAFNNNLLRQILQEPSQLHNYGLLIAAMLHSYGVLAVAYSPYLLVAALLLFMLKRNGQLHHFYTVFMIPGLLVVFVLMSGSVAGGLARGLLDAEQLFNNLYPLFNLWLAGLLIYGYEKLHERTGGPGINKHTVILVLFMGASACNIQQNTVLNRFHYGFFSKYSDEYIIQVLQVLQAQNGHSIGVYFLQDADYMEVDFTKTYRRRPGYFIQLIPGYHDLVDVSCYRLHDLKEKVPAYDQYYLQNNEFIRFVALQKSAGRFRSYRASQLDFVDQFGITYAFAAKDARLSTAFGRNIRREICDKKSGERFFVLENR